MFEFFDKIVGFFETIFDLVVNILNSLLSFFRVLMQTTTMPAQIAVFVPSIIGTSFLIVTSICIIKLVVGR